MFLQVKESTFLPLENLCWAVLGAFFCVKTNTVPAMLLQCFQDTCKSTFSAFSFWRKINFISVLIFVDYSSKPSMKNDSKSRSFGSWVKEGFFIKMNYLDNKIEMSFPTFVVVSLSLKFHLQHKLIEIQKEPCCWTVFSCLYKGYQNSQVC